MLIWSYGVVSLSELPLILPQQWMQYGHSLQVCSKISNTFHFLFSNKILGFRVGIHKTLFRIAKQRQSDLLLCTLISIHARIKSFELQHEVSNNVGYATSKASDQPAHMHSLIRAFASRLNIL